MKKMFTLLFTLLFLSVTMFAQQAEQSVVRDNFATNAVVIPNGSEGGFYSDDAPQLTLDPVSRAGGDIIMQEGFESTTGLNLPAGWTGNLPTPSSLAYNTWVAADVAGFMITGVTAHTGARFAGVRTETATAADTWMWSAPMNLTAGTTYAVKFWLFIGITAGQIYDAFEVKIGNAATVEGMTTELYYNTNQDVAPWGLITSYFTATETGEYYLGFHCFTPGTGTGCSLMVDDVSVEEIVANDIEIKAAYPYTQAPITQTLISPLTAQITNVGGSAQTNVRFTVEHNESLIATSASQATLASGATANLSATTATATSFPLGENTLVYTALQDETDENPTSNTQTSNFTGTLNTFATDRNNYTNYHGSTTANTAFGTVYTFTNETTLNQVELMVYGTSAPVAHNFNVTIYEMSGNTAVNPEYIVRQEGSRGTATAWVTVNFPPTVLAAGRYFVCVEETVTTYNIGLLSDNAIQPGVCFQKSGNNLLAVANSFLLRLKVDLPNNDLQVVPHKTPFNKIPVSQVMDPELAIPFPATITARAYNNGVQAQTNIQFTAAFNGNPMGTSNTIPTLAPLTTSANMNITVPAGTAYPTTAGNYDFVYTVTQSETEDNPANNTATLTVEIDNTYALDGIVTPSNGGGSSTPNTLGNIFPIYNVTKIKEVQVGFSNRAGEEAYSVSLYPMTGPTTTSTDPLFTVNANRPVGGWVTLTVPETVLIPGDYFLCINQLGTTNIGISFEIPADFPGTLNPYTKSGNNLGIIPNFGALALRMVMDDYTCTATAPTNLEVVSLTAMTATLSWEGNADAYRVTLSTGGTDIIRYTTENTITVTGLPDDAEFTWRVTAICSASGHPTTLGTPFTTPTCARTLPIAEDFSATLTECWQNFRTAGTANGMAWQFVTSGTYPTVTPKSGTHMATMQSYTTNYSSGTKISLVTPKITDIKTGSILKFWMYRDNGWASNADLVNIYVSPTSVATAGELIKTVNRSVTREPVLTTSTSDVTFNGWHEYWAETPAGDFEYYIVEGVSGYGNNIYIDNIDIYDPCWITATAGPNGTITPSGAYPMVPGTSKTYTFAAATGYVINEVLVDGVNVPAAVAAGSYTFENVAAGSHTIEVLFAKTWTITVTNTTPAFGGFAPATPNPSTYKYYETPTYTFTPNTGYHIDEVVVDGEVVFTGTNPNTAVYTHTFTEGLSADVEITVTFTPNFYTLTLNPNSGMVNPNTVTVYYGLPIGTIPTPTREGYSLDTWNIGATPINAATVWTYLADQTAIATWEPNVYTLTFDPLVGTVNPTSRPVTFNAQIGNNPPLPIPTLPNCQFLGWFMDGAQISATTVWTWASNKTATARWNYGITAINNNPALGTITPSGITYYPLNDEATYTIEPIFGHHITTVEVDGTIVFTGDPEALNQGWEYTFENINNAHTISVGFARNCYTVNIGETEDATVTPTTGCVLHDQEATFIIKADCNEFSVFVDGELHGSFNEYPNFSEVCTLKILADKPLPEITVETTPITYTITAGPAQGVDPMGFVNPTEFLDVACKGNIELEIHRALGYRVAAIKVDGNPVTIPASTFINNIFPMENITANHDITVEFEEAPYYIIQFGPDATQNAGGVVYPTLSENTQYYIVVDSALDCAFTIKPADGYEIDKVYINDVVTSIAINADGIGTYMFAGINANHAIHATFKPVMFNIVATAYEGGTITPNGNVPVAFGSSQEFLVVPNLGYYIDKVVVDGEDKGAITSYSFVDIEGNHTISAFFAKNEYTISTIVTGANGIINPVNPKVLHGDDQKLTFIPLEGYKVNKVIIDGVENLAAAQNGSYTFVNVTQNHTVEVTFIKMTFTIVATHTLGGVINPVGTATLEYGDHSAIYVFIPDPGYHLKQVLVDGVNSYQAIDDNLYRFMDVTANHTIHAIFAPDNHTILATATTGGVITPAGIVNATTGQTPTFVMHPETGYKLVRVLVDNINMPVAVETETYTFAPVYGNHTIAAQFEKAAYNVYLPEATGATAIPQPGYTTTVDHGAQFAFTVELAAGYTQSNIVVRTNNIVITPVGGVYTINNITVDQTITVDGVAINQYTIVATAFAGGSITPSGTFMMNHGDAQLFTISANNGFRIAEVYLNGIPVELDGVNYLLENIVADATIEARFKQGAGITEPEATVTVYSYDNIVTISNEALVPIKSVEIMDMTGRMIWSGQIPAENKTEINLSVAAGIYNVRIITEDNTVSTTKVNIN